MAWHGMVESDKVLLTVHGGDESWMLAVTGNMSELNAIRRRESLGIADIAVQGMPGAVDKR